MAGGKGGGAWKVAYADFVTAMMAFFLVMWLLGYDEETRQSIADYFNGAENAESQNTRGEGSAPEFLPRIMPPDMKSGQRILETEMLQQAAERLAEAFQTSPELSDDIVRFEFLADGMRITVVDRSNRPLFAPGTADLTQLGDWILRSIAWQIERFPLDVELEGHVQSGAENSDGTGWELSSARAESARRALQRNGIVAGRFWRVAGYADRRPLDPGNPDAEENRRIAVLVRLHGDDDAQALREALAVQ